MKKRVSVKEGASATVATSAEDTVIAEDMVAMDTARDMVATGGRATVDTEGREVIAMVDTGGREATAMAATDASTKCCSCWK